MKTIQHTGMVVDVFDKRAEVRVRSPQAQQSCGSCCSCSMGPGGARRVYVNRGDLAEGDYVRITMPVVSGYLSMLVVFFLPMALTVMGMLAGTWFEPEDGGSGGATLLGAVVGLFTSVAIATLVNRRIAGAHTYIVERITQEEAWSASPPPSCPRGEA